MSRKRKSSLKVKAAAGVGAAVLAVGIAAVTVSTSQAATENCAGLEQALANNENFIAQQQANPDAQSEARIANRQAVIDNIQQRLQAAGCQ